MVVSNADRLRIRMALRIAETSKHHRYRHGAVLVCSGNIVATSANILKNSPLTLGGTRHCSVHAEVGVLRKSPNNTIGAVLYVARLSPGGAAALSRPCNACSAMMALKGVSRVCWTVDAQRVGAVRVRDLLVAA